MAKKLKISLLPHEQELLKQGILTETTHKGASARWLSLPDKYHTINEMAILTNSNPENKILVYRHMSDREFSYLRENNQLPDTQPYQTIVCGDPGFKYCMKYFTGQKKVATNVTTIVQFLADKKLIDELFEMHAKSEDGCMSHGLGDKGGKGLPIFNKAMEHGDITWVVRLVKRPEKMKNYRF